MTSPLATLTAERTLYFVATLDGQPQKLETIDCFEGEDLKLVFKFKNANDEEVDMAGAAIEFNLAQCNSPLALLLQKTVGAGITISGSDVTVLFNSGDSAISGWKNLVSQLKVTKTSKMVVAAYGKIVVGDLIE